MATFPPSSCCHTWTLTPHIVRFHTRGPNSAKRETSFASRAIRTASWTSSHSTCTSGWLRSPCPCSRASVSRLSSHRSLLASQRGDSGKKSRATARMRPGTAWTPQAIRKAAGECSALGATVGDQVHNQDTPFDGPLLDADDSATDTGWSQFSEVDADLRRGDAHLVRLASVEFS